MTKSVNLGGVSLWHRPGEHTIEIHHHYTYIVGGVVEGQAKVNTWRFILSQSYDRSVWNALDLWGPVVDKVWKHQEQGLEITYLQFLGGCAAGQACLKGSWDLWQSWDT